MTREMYKRAAEKEPLALKLFLAQYKTQKNVFKSC